MQNPISKDSVAITAMNYGDFAQAKPEVQTALDTADAVAGAENGEASVIKNEDGICMIRMTYDVYLDKHEDVHIYQYEGGVLVHYNVRYKTDDDAISNAAKSFIKQLTDIEL